MEDPRECVDLIDDWYVRRGDGRIGRDSGSGSSIDVSNLTAAGFPPDPCVM